MKLLGRAKDTTDADKDSEKVPRLENVEVILVHCNLVNIVINKHQEYYLLLYQISNMVN